MAALSGLPPAVIEYLLEGPGISPPEGVSAAATASDSLDTPNTIVFVLAVSIATLALCSRLYTKVALIRQWNLEDSFLVVAWIMFLFYSAESQLAVELGIGHHMWNIQLAQFFKGIYHINLTAIAYCVVVALIKLAILLQYIRIFVPSRNANKGLWYTLYISIAIIAVFYTIVTFLTTFICYPRAAYWDPYVKGSCLNWLALLQAAAIFALISDFALLIIPIFPVYKLHVPRKKKIMIGALFAIGFIDCVASIMRVYYSYYQIALLDIAWDIAFTGMWAWIEMSFGIVVACLPVSPRFYKHVRDCASKYMSSSRRRLSRAPNHSNEDFSDSTTLHSPLSPTKPHFPNYYHSEKKEGEVRRPEKVVFRGDVYEFEQLSNSRSMVAKV